MPTLAQMKRKDVRFLKTIFNISTLLIKLPFIVFCYIGDYSEEILHIIDRKGFKLINWYTKTRNINKSGFIEK